jgi:hypothetical protein
MSLRKTRNLLFPLRIADSHSTPPLRSVAQGRLSRLEQFGMTDLDLGQIQLSAGNLVLKVGGHVIDIGRREMSGGAFEEQRSVAAHSIAP